MIFILKIRLLPAMTSAAALPRSIPSVTQARYRKFVIMNAPLYPGYSAPGLGLLKLPLVGGMLTGDWFLQRTLRGGVEKPQAMSDSLLSEYLKPFQSDPGTRVALFKQVKELNLDAVLEKEVVPNLSKLQVPTLIIWGDRDTYVPLDVGKEIKKNVPGVRIVCRPDDSTLSYEERPEDVRQRLKEFIDQQ